jgi:hypothetical protein
MIEIEGAALTPSMIPNVLGSILEQLNSWIDTVMSKSDVGGGAVNPSTPAQPGSTSSPQPTTTTEDP